jgi:hypothetical protein
MPGPSRPEATTSHPKIGAVSSGMLVLRITHAFSRQSNSILAVTASVQLKEAILCTFSVFHARNGFAAILNQMLEN